jgi:hypothetical protein
MQVKLSLAQKRDLYRDGYVIVRGALAPELVERARARIRAAQKGESLAVDRTMTDLVNASSVTPILHDALGFFDPPTVCHIAINKRRDPGNHFNSLGYRDCDMPYLGSNLHAEGSCSIGVPQTVQEGAPDEIYRRYIASGPKGDLGRSPDVIGHNSVPLFEDPAMTLGLGNISAFVFACLSPQTEPGCGQTAVLPGSHLALQDFLRWQRSVNDCLGPEGPGWPRLDHSVPNRCGLVYTPQTILDRYITPRSKTTPDGRQWPEPTLVLMEPGDVCIASGMIIHDGSRNEIGSESRKSIIFRLRAKSRQPNIVVSGGHDHPDRGPRGEWLEFEPGNDPWTRSKDAMCDLWAEWEGMQDVARDARGNVQVQGLSTLSASPSAAQTPAPHYS